MKILQSLSKLIQQFRDTLSWGVNFKESLLSGLVENQTLKNLLSSLLKISYAVVSYAFGVISNAFQIFVYHTSIAEDTRTLSSVIMKAFNQHNALFVCFDTSPLDDPIRMIGTIFSGSPYSHVRLIDQVVIEDEGYFTTVIELTHEGVHIEMFEIPAHQLVFEPHCNMKVVPRMMGLTERALMHEKLHYISQLNLRWSNCYMLPWLMGKQIPSLTCSSLVSHLLIDELIPFPKKLLEVLNNG